MQKQFSSLVKEKSLSHVESYVKDPANITNQLMMLSDITSNGDIATAFEKVTYSIVHYFIDRVKLFNIKKYCTKINLDE